MFLSKKIFLRESKQAIRQYNKKRKFKFVTFFQFFSCCFVFFFFAESFFHILISKNIEIISKDFTILSRLIIKIKAILDNYVQIDIDTA